jgi:hypothetical protein
VPGGKDGRGPGVLRGCPGTARRQPAGQDEHGGDLVAAGRRDGAAIGVAEFLETERLGQAADRSRQPAFQGRDQVVQGVWLSGSWPQRMSAAMTSFSVAMATGL